MNVGLPQRLVVRAFEGGTAVAGIADGFGCEPKDVVDCIVQYYREQGAAAG